MCSAEVQRLDPFKVCRTCPIREHLLESRFGSSKGSGRLLGEVCRLLRQGKKDAEEGYCTKRTALHCRISQILLFSSQWAVISQIVSAAPDSDGQDSKGHGEGKARDASQAEAEPSCRKLPRSFAGFEEHPAKLHVLAGWRCGWLEQGCVYIQ